MMKKVRKDQYVQRQEIREKVKKINGKIPGNDKYQINKFLIEWR